MSDIKTSQERSYNMSRIRGKNTKPEEVVRKYLFSKGFRYRKNDSRYPGHPDIVLPRYRTIVFVNGCCTIPKGLLHSRGTACKSILEVSLTAAKLVFLIHILLSVIHTK